MTLYQRISNENRTKYGTEAERVLRIIINQYSDRTHFIYEILQNAEDAGATRINFKLEKDKLLVFHNGRPFNEKDIVGVCGIANGTKEDGTRIGHFGIGFKSVYCYTESPYIYSGDYHFIIKSQLFPEEVPGKKDLDYYETCMSLPFNKSDVPANIAFEEIKNALIRKINAESILMLNNIADVKIEIQGHAEIIEINKQKNPLDKNYLKNVFGLSVQTTITNTFTGNYRTNDTDYLYFTDANTEAVSIIFKEEEHELKPIKNSKIYAFFPTAKEAHQNFYIHAPFDTTPARDNFKEGAEYGKHNIKLVENIGKLIWFALTWMKDHKYLSVSGFNTVFPIYEYEKDDILYGIYQNSINIIREEIILPTNNPHEFKRINEIFMPFAAVITEIFNDEDLRYLTSKRNNSWLAKEFTTDAYADIRKFLLNNFRIQTLEWKDIVPKIDAFFLKKKSTMWIETLMARIESYCVKYGYNDGRHFDASKIPFVKITSGDYICARDEKGKLQVYLNNPDIALYRIDAQFIQSDTIKSFYRRALEIPEYNIEQEAIEHILPKYQQKKVSFKTDNPIQENIEDLKIIKDAIYTNPGILPKIVDKYIVTDGREWYRPYELYIKSDDIRTGYSLVKGIFTINYLADDYLNSTLASIRLDEEFFKRIGCNYGISQLDISQEAYLKAVRRYQGPQIEMDLRRSIFSKKHISKKLNWAFCYEGFPDVFRNMTKERSLAIAKFLNPNAMSFDIQGELVGADDQHFSGKNVDSTMAYSMIGLMLCHEKWIYIKDDDKPHSPLEVDKDDILSEYKIAKRLISILPFKEVKNAFTEWLESTFDNEAELNQIKHFISKPEDLAKMAKAYAKSQAKEEAKKGKAKSVKDLIQQGDKDQKEHGDQESELEVSPISEKGKKRREQNLDKELAESLDSFIGIAKGLQFASRSSNAEERLFLEQEYDGHCQICLKKIIKHNGEVYFEAINIIKFSKLPEKLANSSKYGWNSLCLCPNCAAEYNYASKKISTIYDQVMSLDAEPNSEETIDIDIEMPKGKQRRIRYTPRHFIALKQAFKMFAELQ